MACPNSPRQVKSKSRACSSLSLTSRGLFTNNSSWQAKQSILHTTVTFYGEWVKMCEDFAPNFGDKRTSCCMTTHRLTLPFSLKKQHDCRPPPTLLFSVSSTEVKTERLPFCHNQDDQGESQVVLNTLTENDFWDAFKKMTKALRMVHTHGRGLLWGWWWSVGPKLVFDQIDSTSPGIYEYLIVFNNISYMILPMPTMLKRNFIH
jgi:hypothetical protein